MVLMLMLYAGAYAIHPKDWDGVKDGRSSGRRAFKRVDLSRDWILVCPWGTQLETAWPNLAAHSRPLFDVSDDGSGV